METSTGACPGLLKTSQLGCKTIKALHPITNPPLPPNGKHCGLFLLIITIKGILYYWPNYIVLVFLLTQQNLTNILPNIVFRWLR